MNYQSGAVHPIESIKQGWELIKDSYWVFLAMTLVTIAILFILSFVLNFITSLFVGVIFGGLGYSAGTTAPEVTLAIVPQIVSLFIGFFTSVIISTISGILICGIYSALSRKANQGIAGFGDLFSAFDKLMPCFTVAIIFSIIGFIVGLVTLVSGSVLGVRAIGLGSLMGKDGQFNPAALSAIFGIGLLFIIGAIIFNLIYSALTAFVYPLIAEQNLSGGEAFIMSLKSGLANLFGLVLLILLLGLMGIGGALACLVGFLFVVPIIVASMFAAYRSVFGGFGNQMYQTPPPPPGFGY
jgi:hypothetical protein